MADSSAFTRLVPGFDFLQEGLVKDAAFGLAQRRAIGRPHAEPGGT